ncbi:MAG: membrane protein insertase YidC [Candidatus Methylacidiphilales bacterium]
MDRTSWIVIGVCFLLLLAYQPLVQYFYPPPPPPPPGSEAPSQVPAPTDPSRPSQADSSPLTIRPEPSPLTPAPAKAQPIAPTELGPEQIAVLENDSIRLELTSHGGGIRRAFLKEHRSEGTRQVELNRGSDLPIFNLTGWFGHDLVEFELVEANSEQVTFRKEIAPGLELIRTFRKPSNFLTNVTQTIRAEKDAQPVFLPDFQLHVGLATSVHLSPGERTYIRGAWSDTSGGYKSDSITAFDGFHLLGITLSRPKPEIRSPAGDPLRWVAVKDQFFVIILASETEPIESALITRQTLPGLQIPNEPVPDGIDAVAFFRGFQVNPGQEVQQTFALYTGPKEDRELRAMPFRMDQVMEFGFMAFISRPMLMCLNFIHDFVGNYGLSIVFLTIFLKLLLWPLQSKANMAMKRMQVVAPVMQELQAKYKDNPQKMNEEMLKLYQNYGLNPLGGCLPLLLQMPLFLGFYYMLLSSIELRHASFLWIHDLSMPDTVFQFPFLGINVKLNPMPLIMAGTMYWSMHVTPQPSGVNNPAQKIIKFMPLIFLLFCYNFASALSLYWTVQNLLSVLQIYLNSKKPMPTLEELKAQAAEKRKRRKALEQRFKQSAPKRKP